jgi:hypothetical protein
MDLLGKILGILREAVLILFFCALPVMLLWNETMPYIFKVVEVSLWQSLLVSLLAGLLFKGSNSNNKN